MSENRQGIYYLGEDEEGKKKCAALSRYVDVKKRCKGNLATMYKTVTTWLNTQAEGDNWDEIDELNEVKRLIEFSIIQNFMELSGYHYNNEAHEWKGEE